MITPAAAAQIQKGATTPSMGVLASLLGFRMRRVHAHLTRSFAERLADKALRPGGFSALALIAANPGLSQQALSLELGQDKATVVALLDELETRGWAERRRAVTDRRRHRLLVTEAGAVALAEMAATASSNERQVVAALSPEEAEVLMRLLDKLYHACFSPDAQAEA
jgi:DNA-binding MarR family transcriptional regulator